MNRCNKNIVVEINIEIEAMYRFMLWLVPTVKGFPRSQKFMLGDRIQTNAIDILESISVPTFFRGEGAEIALNLYQKFPAPP